MSLKIIATELCSSNNKELVIKNINSLYYATRICDLLNYGKLLKRDYKGELDETEPVITGSYKYKIVDSNERISTKSYTRDLRKLIVCDNFDRETVSDILISDNINNLYSDRILYLLRETVTDLSDDYFKLVCKDYVLYDCATLY